MLLGQDLVATEAARASVASRENSLPNTAGSRDLRLNRARGGGGIGGIPDRPPHDKVVGPGDDGPPWRRDMDLIPF
jgi:hypothetical protein